jgi:hypothetical protein
MTVEPADGANPPTMSFGIALATESARRCFEAWRAARHGERLPELTALAPAALPREVLPWTLLYRLRPDGEIIYAVVGHELTFLFKDDVRGRPILGYADPAERARRVAIMKRVMVEARPIWFTGRLLFENRAHVPVGRLGLPARDGQGLALLMIYFLMGELPRPISPPLTSGPRDADPAVWCTDADLVHD